MRPHSSNFNSQRQKQLSWDPRNCAIYFIFFFFVALWVLAVCKVALLESARKLPVLHTAARPVMAAHEFDRVHMRAVQADTESPAIAHLASSTRSISKSISPKNKGKSLTYIKAPQPPPEPTLGIVPTKPARALTWPPVALDGSIPPEDGHDNMTMTNLHVPRFWDPPPDIPLEEVGSKIGEVETIFLMIASYRDFQCRETIASAFANADHPEALFIGAVDQLSAGDIACTKLEVSCESDPDQMNCKYRNQISSFTMSAEMATGPVTARHIGDRMYRGQYFVMQMDAHCQFVKHWDTLLIAQWRATKNEMAVLSSYLSDVQGAINPKTGKSNRNTRPIMCNSAFEGAAPARYLRHGSQPEDYAVIREMPQLQPFWAAGFSFSRGHFKVRVPYDGRTPMVFQGEEISIGIRGFTYGYDYYSPRDSVVFHEYATKSSRRSKIHMFWENSPKHKGEGVKSLKRLMSIIKMARDIPDAEWDHSEQNRYGIGNVRDLDQFYKLFLIDANKRTSVQLCPFVKSGAMHRQFMPYLRSNRMGIDYSNPFFQNFDTEEELEKVFVTQRPGGEKMIQNAMKNRAFDNLRFALENAKRIKLDQTNPELFKKGQEFLRNNGG